MKNQKSNRRPRNRVALFYKSHGKFVGPWGGETFSKSAIREMRESNELSYISNYILRSPLQLRKRVA